MPASDKGEEPGRPLPRSRRGRSTRAALLSAAREVFERDGFLEAKVTDIAATAGVASGSFYTHFADKHEVFAAVLDEAKEEMLHPGVQADDPDQDPTAVIERSNRAYLESYRDNAGLMRLLEQVSTIDESVRNLRLKRSRDFHERNARQIESLQRRGLADSELDPMTASVALSAMVSRTAYGTFAIGDDDVNVDLLVRTLSRLWANALKLPSPEG